MRALNLRRKTTVRSVTVIARPNWTQLALWTVDVRPVTYHHLISLVVSMYPWWQYWYLQLVLKYLLCSTPAFIVGLRILYC